MSADRFGAILMDSSGGPPARAAMQLGLECCGRISGQNPEWRPAVRVRWIQGGGEEEVGAFASRQPGEVR